MKSNDKVLEIISSETIKDASKMGVVTPAIYSSIFAKKAQGHNTELGDDIKLSNDILNDKISMLSNLQDETAKNAIKLSDSTAKAISAIQNKNDAILNDVLQETNELKKEIERLKESVYKDELTHAYNRKWLNDNFLDGDQDKFTKAGTLAIIDLNYFKIINDTYGHVIGDKVLVFISNQLKGTKEDVIRYGGDEFMVIFPENILKETALKSLNNIRDELLTKRLKAGEATFKVSFSFGVKEFKINDALSDIIEAADKDMYNDKIEIKKIITGID